MRYPIVTLASMLVMTGTAFAQPPSRQQLQALLGACRADARDLCPGMRLGDRRLNVCIAEHEAELSQPCLDTILAFKAARQSRLRAAPPHPNDIVRTT